MLQAIDYQALDNLFLAVPLWPVIALAGANLLGSIFNARQSRKNTKAQIAYQQQEAERERASNMEMWKLQTAYNSPKEQMARLQSAGLNPNLAYGSGNVAGLSADTPKGYERAGNVDFHQQQSVLGNALQAAPAVLSMYQDYKMKDTQIKIAQKENAYREALLSGRAALLAEQGELTRQRAKETALRAPYAGELAKYTLEAKEAQIEKIRQDTKALKLENQLNEMLKPYGLTSRDSALVRQIVRVMSDDNPGISALDIMLLLPTLLPGLGAAGRIFRGFSKVKKPMTKVKKPMTKVEDVVNMNYKW